MKSNRETSRRSPDQNGTKRPTPELSRTKRLVFRLLVLVGLPFLVLLAAELGLRLAGYGYSTAFFKPLRIGGEEYLVENDKFGWRFFPPEVSRSPAPVAMKAHKAPGTFRIFVLGESAALGDPRPAYGAARYLQALLSARYPDRKFEVICGAMTAINSHAVLPIARECARYQGDLWIVYMGNNEMIGPYGASTVFGSQSPPLAYVRMTLALQKTRLGQWLVATARRVMGGSKPGASWGGMKMFLENRIAAHDRRKEVVYSSFEKNLRDILHVARQAGVPVVLSSVAVNLKDCAPFASLVNSNVPAADQTVFESALAAGEKAEAQSDFAAAARQYEQAAKIEPEHAETHFRWGTCLLAQSNTTPALEHLELACDADALPFRTDSRLNDVIRQVGARLAGPDLVSSDPVAWFAAHTPAGIPGKEWFYEHVHPNFDGNYRLACIWAEAATKFLPVTSGSALASWPTQEACERRLGLTDWNRYSVLEDMLNRLSQAPFTGQLNHAAQVEELRTRMRELHRHMDSAAAEKAKALYREALQAAPADHRLHENFAEFLEMTGDLRQAVAEWQRVSELIPQHHLAYFQTGRLLLRLAKLEDAQKWLLQAVALRPDLGEGWLELGKIHALQGQLELALKDYARERELVPQDARVYYHIGKALSQLHRRTEALQSFRQALALEPNNWEARYALGEELAFDNKPAEARREFEQVIREKPDYPMAHLNLGVAFVQLGDLDQAMYHFQEVTRLDPQNKLAPAYLEKVRAAKAQQHSN